MNIDDFIRNLGENSSNPEFLLMFIREQDKYVAKSMVREKCLSLALTYMTTVLSRNQVPVDEHAARFIATLGKAISVDRPLEYMEADYEKLNYAFSDLKSQQI